MDFELDHFFICVSEGGGPEADRLSALGLVEGAPNTHPGQGTACRRFFFANAYLELLWVSDAAEAQAAPADRLRLWERWTGRLTGTCPFGVCLRPIQPGANGLPFDAWEYRPSYLPSPLCIHIEANSSSVERPSLFYLSFGRWPDSRPAPDRQPMRHPVGFQEITRGLVRGPHLSQADGTGFAGAIAFQTGEEHLMEVGFDGEQAGLRADLRPLLPLVFHW